MNEARDSTVSTVIEDLEFTYKGLDFMVSFEASGNVEYEAPTDEEGHGFHKIGGGWQVEDIMISNIKISVSILDKYVSIYEDSEVEEEIINFLLADKVISNKIQQDLLDAHGDMGDEVE
jgi:hypothetical protein